jgi:glycosyltransferase involved in cell wall biosynthesis
MKKYSLALFLELGGSLKEWDDVGFFSREILLYNELAKNFFETIYIFTYGNKQDLYYKKFLEKNIQIIPRGKHSGNYFINFLYELWMPFKYRNILKKCAIFKTNQNSGALAPSIAKIFLPSRKLVVRSGYIGSELSRRAHLPITTKLYYAATERISYFLCDQIFITTDENRDILIKNYPFVKKKILVLNNSINTELFKPLPNEKKIDIIYVARFNKDKNHQALIKSIQGLGLKVLFIGRGETLKKIKTLAENSGVHITHIDRIPNNELPQYYNSAQMCVFPSLHEGNPKSLLEAMSCGLPIVALDSPGINNIIKNETNGLIGGIASIRNNILRLSNNTELCAILGSEAQKTVLEKYSFKKILEREITTYKKLLPL